MMNGTLIEDKANEVFNKIKGNIAGVEWEVEIQEPAVNMPKLNNNQYAALAGDEDDNKSWDDQEKKREIIGVQHDDKITGVDSDNRITGVNSEPGSTGATNKMDEMALIEEAIAETERDIAEGTNIIAGTETETEDTQNKNVIHPDFLVPIVEHTYNFREEGIRGRTTQMDMDSRLQ